MAVAQDVRRARLVRSSSFLLEVKIGEMWLFLEKCFPMGAGYGNLEIPARLRSDLEIWRSG